jgi:hypothetical protein
MTSQYRHRRTSVATVAFPVIEPGEIAVNTANRQIAVGDAAGGTTGTPKLLIAIRYFDTTAQYATNDFVVNGTSLYRARNATGPGAFVPADWAMMVGTIDPQYVAKAGDTMGGMLSLPATTPTAGVHATNKAYVDGLVAAKSSVLVSDVPPTPTPIDSTLWYNTLDGQLYIRYNDGNSTAWVIAAPQPDASNYTNMIGSAIAASAVRYDVAQALTDPQKSQARQNIAAAPFDAMSYSGMQVNGDAVVSQENGTTSIYGGPGGTTVLKYIADGWRVVSAGAQSISWAADPAVNGVPPGYVSSVAVWSNALNASPGAGEYLLINQSFEGYRIAKLAWGAANARPLSIGFWARSLAPGTYSVAIRNGGGTARSYVATFVVVASSTWEWKTVTFPGCTDGTWYTDNRMAFELDFTIMAGSNFRTAPNVWAAGSFFGATGAINGAGVDFRFAITGLIVLPGIELPTSAQAPLVMRPYDQELLTCQRYWQKINAIVDTSAGFQALSLVPSMRAIPTITGGGAGFTSFNNSPVALNHYQTTRAQQTLIMDARL